MPTFKIYICPICREQVEFYDEGDPGHYHQGIHKGEVKGRDYGLVSPVEVQAEVLEGVINHAIDYVMPGLEKTQKARRNQRRREKRAQRMRDEADAIEAGVEYED